MSNKDRIRVHDREAADYDQQVRAYEYHAPEAIFGMCYEYIVPGQNLLDIGIGTGLSSIWFAKAGLDIYGIDGSAEMLKVCKEKGFASELKQHDILNVPLPYSDNSFNHVLSCGLLHFFNDLGNIFAEIFRIIDGKGVFAFTVAVPPPESAEDYFEIDTPWGVSIYAHADAYITRLLNENGYQTVKRQRFIMKRALEEEGDLVFAAYVAAPLSSI
jgi:predicted TPR repeat methyltransferase